MTVASCPSCQERVTVPVDATSDSVVRCPFCHEEFELKAFLNQLPPSLIVLESGSPGQPGEGSEVRDDGDSFSGKGPEAVLSSPESEDASDSLPPFDFTADSVREEGERPTRRPPQRGARKNPTVEACKIIAGALLAIPAAQIILWWFVPSGYKRDLLRLGPTVSRVAPWVVPGQFHAPPSDASDDRLPPSQPRRYPPRIEQPQAVPRAGNGSALSPPESARQETAEDKTRDPSTKEEARRERDVPAEPDPDVPPVGDGNQEPLTTAEPTEPAPTDRVARGVRGVPRYTLEDVRAALETALQASIRWDADLGPNDPRRAELTTQFYQAFARLSEAMTYPPPNDSRIGDLATALTDVLETFKKQPEKLAMIGNQTAQWLDQSNRSTDGVFLFGTVNKIRRSGQIHETKLELASREKRTVTVVSRVDPRLTFAPTDRILMLGAIVEQPSRNLVGYQGDESMVVMGGFPVVLK
ncbi:MAG: hypothetical protein ACODAD_01495 [Planctomycetota bacterium]